MRSLCVSSCLATLLERFVEFKRSSGYDFDSSIGAVERFDRFVSETATVPEQLNHDLLARFVRSIDRLAPRTRTNVISVVWQALSYAIRHGATCPALPDRPTFRRIPVVEPYAYSDKEISKILLALLELSFKSNGLLRPHTLATVIALLVTTGLRISEALALNIEDIDLDRGVLRIKRGKLGKPRDVPILHSTVEGLRIHLERRERCVPVSEPGAPFFVSVNRDRLRPAAVSVPFKRIVKSLGIVTLGGKTPRLHDLRHTFAVNRVAQWYREGVDVNTRLAALSTYLGHTSASHTAHYLQANESILKEANARFEALWAPRGFGEGGQR